jgi:hypothetical protein
MAERDDETRDDAPLADPARGGSPPNDMPTGLPSSVEEGAPGGLDEEASPEGEGDTPRGEDAMPGIPDKDEPFTGG